MRNRYYNPSIGRFISEDPARDGLNWYAYCGNNPIRYIDPLGLKKENEIITYGQGSFTDIMALQNRLNSLGYVGEDGNPLVVDGDFGNNTNYSVQQFQTCNGLKADGLVGDLTWKALGFENENNIKIIPTTKIDPNTWEDYEDDYYDQNYNDKGRGSQAKKREKNQIDNVFGKNRADREGQSQELHDAKSGKRNDDNYSYDDLKNGNFWSTTINPALPVLVTIIGIGMFIISGGMYVPN